jgi:hypothetical protein
MSITLKERIEAFKETLAVRFGYGRKEAKLLAEEAMDNLDKYVKVQETMIKRFMEKPKK